MPILGLLCLSARLLHFKVISTTVVTDETTTGYSRATLATTATAQHTKACISLQ